MSGTSSKKEIIDNLHNFLYNIKWKQSKISTKIFGGRNHMDKKILIWMGQKQKTIYNEELIYILLKELAIQNRYNVGEYFAKKFSCIFENIDKIATIQIYQDGVIRIIFLHEYRKIGKSIFIEKNDAEELKTVLEENILNNFKR